MPSNGCETLDWNLGGEVGVAQQARTIAGGANG